LHHKDEEAHEGKFQSLGETAAVSNADGCRICLHEKLLSDAEDNRLTKATVF
jgi:hypothetical protein